MLCGAAPLPASSGMTTRHRRGRGGDRAANSALHMIAVSRWRVDPTTQAYVARKRAAGHSTPRSCDASSASSPARSTTCSKTVTEPPGNSHRPLDTQKGVRGGEYTAHLTAASCVRHGLRRSMGATGICWDNSPSESLWPTIKHEEYYRHVYATRSELVAAVYIWIIFYNTVRRHSAVGIQSPDSYEKSLQAAVA
jgi:hypothetical protein